MRALAGALTLGLIASPALAVDIFKRIQAHGYYESQIRVQSMDFSDDYDLGQWYHIFNVELEADIIPDGWGYIDLLSAFVRLEGRYDCVYSHGCGLIKGADTYGDDAERLPRRLSSAEENTFHGQIRLPSIKDEDNFFRDTNGDGIADTTVQEVDITRDGDLVFDERVPQPLSEMPGFSGLAGQDGVDGYIGAPPFGTVPLNFGAKPDPGGPWALLNDDPFDAVFGRFSDFRFTAVRAHGGGSGGRPNAVLGPWLPKNFVTENAALADILNPFDATVVNPVIAANAHNGVFYAGIPGNAATSFQFNPGDIDPVNTPGKNFENWILSQTVQGTTPPPLLATVVNGANARFNSVQVATDPSRLTTASLFRPIPINDAGRFGEADGVARGLYLPSRGLVNELNSGRLDPLPFNIDEKHRAFNRGASQDEGELKEAYIDLETFDSRLWLRIGKQNIVWGKTELFRTTDQFNPTDLALYPLASLEEARIALWSARAVYSFYEVGPLEDVRVEFAVNIDDYENSDLGACGEPFTFNVVCGAAFGAFAHGTFGLGVAGGDTPEDPWIDKSNFEFGGRLEFRWDRFSFAIMDFYGFEDLPYVDVINTYERNVDPMTGRGRAAGMYGPCATQPMAARQRSTDVGFAPDPDCLQAGPSRRRGAVNLLGNPISESAFPTNENLANAGDAKIANQLDPTNPGFNPALVTDAFGNIYDPTDGRAATYSPNNALEAHPSNQQLYGVVCAATLGVSSLDAAGCVASVFSSGALTTAGPLSQVISAYLAGAPTAQNTLRTASGTDSPIVRLNRDSGDGEIGGSLGAAAPCLNGVWCNSQRLPNGTVVDANPNGGGLELFVGYELVGGNQGCIDNSHFLRGTNTASQDRQFLFVNANGTTNDIPCHSGGAGIYAGLGQALGQHLSKEQQALLGCGAFWGTNCDDSGIDFLNLEASTLLQTFPGFEGSGDPAGGMNFSGPANGGGITPQQWTTTNTKYDPATNLAFGRAMGPDGQDRIQPGTRHYAGGPVGTVYDRPSGAFLTLPGARGPWMPNDPSTAFVESNTPNPAYDSSVDGCVDALQAGCAGSASANGKSNARISLDHPLANIDPYTSTIRGRAEGGPLFMRNYVGARQQFSSEMAALSWNFLMLLTTVDNEFIGQADAFALCQPDESVPPAPGTGALPGRNRPCELDASGNPIPVCSLATPQHCPNVRGFFGLAGLTRNTMRAGGTSTFGRRTFLWHGASEAVLRFAQRNVVGFSMDFAEDNTKSNWGIEATWIPGVPRGDSDSFNGITEADDYNITVSVDRPTFINFLNANRTFFLNAQFFFQYRDGWREGFGSNGPWNFLFTIFAQTGFFQDRLLPSVVFVYDVQSNSGAVLPQITYRYTEALSLQIGMQIFSGNQDYNPMSINPIGPPSNQVGRRAYQNAVNNGLTILQDSDNFFIRLRYTF